MPNWTDEQKQAIYEKGKNILVAAAAGSGKTAVLVERMINKVINEGIDIDKILVVTFTNAAAAEMRERILDALYKKLEENPDDERLQKQINLLNMASICTIDSFCLEVVKSNFYELENMSPNFRIADTPEIELLKQEILEELFEKKYLEENEDFSKLITTYTNYRDDTPLKDLILKIHTFISSSPFPEKWLDDKIEMFNLENNLERDFSQTIWGKILLKEIDEEVKDDKIILKDVYETLTYDSDLEPFAQIIASDIEQLNTLEKHLNNWDESYEIAKNLKFITWSRKKVESEIKDEAKIIRDSVKEKLYKKLNKIFVTTSKESNQDILDMYYILLKLKNLLLEFNDIFTKRKKEKNIVDFSDVEHLALKILLKEENGKLVKTEVAKKYTNKFEEIAIDEYQDSNLVQESILTSVSRGNNLFMVGDVKQSIYKFRQAMPKLFLDKYENYNIVSNNNEKFIDNNIKEEKYIQEQIGLDISLENSHKIEQNKNLESNIDLNIESKAQLQEKKEETESTFKLPIDTLKGEKIQLFKNFRSRDKVLDFTNLIFQDIMSKKLGDVEYNKTEYLNLGALDYKENSQDLTAEIDLINKQDEINMKDETSELFKAEIKLTDQDYDQDGEDAEKDDAQEKERIEDIELEAKYIAKKIKELVAQKYQIYDRKKEKFRDIKYKDIVILLRSTKDKANIYEQEIINSGMPVFSDSTEQYLDTIEIQTIMSLLKIIDNPVQDIPLVAVLRSNIGKFTDNDLVEIRLTDKYCDFYHCMQKAKVNVNKNLKEKIDNFLNMLQQWREEQEYLALDELIWKIYMDTGYYHYVGLMPNGTLRQANLRILFERAKQYESASFKGLYQFIQFIEKIQLSSGDLGSAKIIGENDDVIRIMSIHKSKGLEFPVVFLANTNKQFNMQDIRKDPCLLHQDLGIGAKYIDYNAQVQYDTLTREAVKRKIETENISEEMRVLYVALTRAKEKLYITGVVKKIDEKLEKMEKQISMYKKENDKINPILVKKAKSYLEWMLYVYLYQKQNSKLPMKLNIENKDDLLKKWNTEEQIKEQVNDKIFEDEETSKKELEEIKEKIEYQYPYILASKIPTKTSVTKLKEIIIDQEQEKKEVDDKNTINIGVLNQNINIKENDKSNIENMLQSREEIKIEVEGKAKTNQQELFRKPNFIKEDKDKKLTPAEKGTIMHLVLQKINPKENYDLEGVKEFLLKLEEKGIINSKEKETINPNKILQFTNSKLGKELKEAKEIYKEKPFYISIPAKEIYKDETLEEEILVQGIIDLYYIDKNDKLVLVDYKTDYITEENKDELIKRYKGQLELYKRALEESLQKRVDREYIYSTYVGEIEI